MIKKDQGQFSEDKQVLLMKNTLMAYSITIKEAILDYIPKVIISLYINEILNTIETQFVGVFSHKDSLEKLLIINNKKLTMAQNAEQEISQIKKALSLLDHL